MSTYVGDCERILDNTRENQFNLDFVREVVKISKSEFFLIHYPRNSGLKRFRCSQKLNGFFCLFYNDMRARSRVAYDLGKLLGGRDIDA